MDHIILVIKHQVYIFTLFIEVTILIGHTMVLKFVSMINLSKHEAIIQSEGYNHKSTTIERHRVRR